MIHHFLINIKHFFQIFTNLFKISPPFVQNDINVITFPLTFLAPLTLAPPAPRVTLGPSSALDINADAPRALRSRTRPTRPLEATSPARSFFPFFPDLLFPSEQLAYLTRYKSYRPPEFEGDGATQCRKIVFRLCTRRRNLILIRNKT